ncbi:MAG: hypothetical protein M1829_000460 [Trizodia sp. TS-e1964]|nr:MAG: hypothetical protein M1829_000460 [Trizodia sp. TS-e1964]
MAATVFKSYRLLRGRVVDLIGDLAGSSLFLIEGDSLLLQCFGDKHIDFTTGFQLLHAIYAVERFLAQLIKRKCNFHIVFFQEHSKICIPPQNSSFASRYLLARSALIRHFSTSLNHTHPEIEIRYFDSCRSEEFDQYMVSAGAYFFMCHDGSQPYSVVGDSTVSEESAELVKASQRVLRSMIVRLAHTSYSVALLNELELRDSKILAYVIEGKRRQSGESSNYLTQPSQENVLENPENITRLIEKYHNQLSEREYLAIISFSEIPSEKLLQALFLVHLCLLKRLFIHQRSFTLQDSSMGEEATMFVDGLSLRAENMLSTAEWSDLMESHAITSDVADLLDGRLFRAVLHAHEEGSLRSLLAGDLMKDYQLLCEARSCFISRNFSMELENNPALVLKMANVTPPSCPGERPKLLPFSNPIFDKHLASVYLSLESFGMDNTHKGVISREVSHWHNPRKLLTAKSVPQKLSAWQLKHNQRLMAEIAAYAASLTNSSGRILEPEIITATGPSNIAKSSKASSHGTSKALSKKDQQLAEIKRKNALNEMTKALAAWKTKRLQLDLVASPEQRYLETISYLKSISKSKTSLMQSEHETYILQALLAWWALFCKKNQKQDGYHVAAALIWDCYRRLNIFQRHLTKDSFNHFQKVSQLMGFPVPKPLPEVNENRTLSFNFIYPVLKDGNLKVEMPLQIFQLLYCGPYMDRHTDSQPDNRVKSFEPDKWQRQVLDELDSNNSLLIVAPTSAGKTFISFYAMEKILRDTNDGVLVYIAPTKALVNQIAAEIQGRFSKKYPHAGNCVWAIHTRDHRVNSAVTVPHILQIMLLAPSNAKTWAPRVKTIIFDEVHCIGQADDGLVWEQLLLLAPCQIIALSATVGNPEEFKDWLASAQASVGKKFSMIQHHQRYSDLRKFVYSPPKSLIFDGIKPPTVSTTTLGLDHFPNFKFLHPVASLTHKSYGIPHDFSLEPRDCLYLWETMVRHQKNGSTYVVPKDLKPEAALPTFIRKVDVFTWATKLINILNSWMQDSNSPFDLVLKDFRKDLVSLPHASLIGSPTESEDNTSNDLDAEETEDSESEADELIDTDSSKSTQIAKVNDPKIPKASTHSTNLKIDPQNLCSTSLPLLLSLNSQAALPAILFHYERLGCEKIARTIMEQLESAEAHYKRTNPDWLRKMKEWEQHIKLKSKTKVKDAKEGKKARGKNEEADATSKEDAMRDKASRENSYYDSFDPEVCLEMFSFVDKKKEVLSEIKEYKWKLRWLAPWLISMLQRGIGVHHAGMNRKYRQTVEVLFRKGYLRVVVATGTLSLGINMPCKTVVFCGDSIFLTALNFRQAAGRAGRRGFDLLGNVVFQGIDIDKACRLISSRLPDLNGHFPITTTLVLRLFTLLDGSGNSPYAQMAINSLLSQPRLYLGSTEFRYAVLHHLRFSIEYLRRQNLLNSEGVPTDHTQIISHLYFTENSSFAFHALLREGYFAGLCKKYQSNRLELIRILMLVMSHLFGRRLCTAFQMEDLTRVIHKSPSIVILPSLPQEALKILEEHDKDTLATFTTYVKTYVDQHLPEPEKHLPLTQFSTRGKGDETASKILHSSTSAKARSPFVALSGHGDMFESIEALCSTVRNGVFLESSVVPHLNQENSAPLNAYLYDFFRHGSLDPLEKANGIRKSDVWFILKDFSLVLATIVTSLTNFFRPSGEPEISMTSVDGVAIAKEFDEDLGDKEGDASEGEVEPVKPAASSIPVKLAPYRKAKVQESWDDEEDEDENWDGVGKEIEGKIADDGDDGDAGLRRVYQAFMELQQEFDTKFIAIGA